MKGSTILLGLISGIGIVYSIYKLFTGQGGGGLGDFFGALGYTSIILFLASLTIIVINYRQLKKHFDTFLFLLLGLPMTVMATGGLIENINYNRIPDLTPKYPKPVTQQVFAEDSMRIAVQVDSLVALRNRETHGIKVLSAVVDTIFYSQSGKEIFVVYAQQFEPNHLGNDLDPAYLSAGERDSIYWHLQEGTPNAEKMSGSYHNIVELKNAVRKFYFNQYSFLDKDSLKVNYFWKQVHARSE
jgi:hypothetical protein